MSVFIRRDGTATTTPGVVSENPPCFALDLYGYPVKCNAPDPCLTHFGQTLYSVTPCTAANPPVAQWCIDWLEEPTHPACFIPVVEVGSPPTLPAELPSTGAAPAGSLILASIVLAVGVVVSAIASRAMAQHPKEANQ